MYQKMKWKLLHIFTHVMNKIARDKGFDKTGFRIINNCGHDGGQEVKHIHYHVLAGKKLPLYEAMEK